MCNRCCELNCRNGGWWFFFVCCVINVQLSLCCAAAVSLSSFGDWRSDMDASRAFENALFCYDSLLV
jgi:hypothetical protein